MLSVKLKDKEGNEIKRNNLVMINKPSEGSTSGYKGKCKLKTAKDIVYFLNCIRSHKISSNHLQIIK